MNDRDAFDAVRHAAMWFTPSEDGLAPLLDLIGDARLVLTGEASHGTEEFYRIRANLTSALHHERDAAAALDDFVRFPRWMWRNTVVVDFVEWLWRFTDPEAAARARRRYEAPLAWTTDRSGYAPAVVWAHNSHLGDARATQMGDWGELNLGQFARERLGNKVFLVGFTTHAGTVTAAREWDAPAERRPVTPSLQGSYERLFHDAVIHVGMTNALTPLERRSREHSDLPETYPTGV